MSAEEIERELALLGSADISDYLRVSEDGAVTMIPLDQLDKGKSRCVRKIRERRVIKTLKGTKDQPDGDMILESTVEYELWDKVKSLELLGRYRGMDKLTVVNEKGKTWDMTDDELLSLARRGSRGVIAAKACEKKPTGLHQVH
jgi:hypothetical protein